MIESPDTSELTAYVDGELSPDRAARVAQAVADDRELAREVAALLRLKTATIAAFDVQAPPMLEVARRSRPKHTVTWAASAALIGVMLLAATTVGFVATRSNQTDGDRIVALKDAWNTDRALSPKSPLVSATSMAKDGNLIRLLQGLAEVQLSIIRSQQVADGMAFDLLGPSGCRLAVWAGPASVNLATAPALQRELRTRRAIVWRADSMQFLLISQNVPEQKFAAMVAALQRATQEISPTDSTTLSLLAEARSQGSPCVA